MQHSQAHFDFESLLANLPDSESELLAAIYVLEERNERELALQMLELATKKCPSGELRRTLAERYLFRRNLIRAQELLVEQILDEPEDGQGLLLLARAYSGLGQIERARESLQRAHASGIAQDRILFWADKLNIPATRLAPATPAEIFAGFDDLADEHADANDETQVILSSKIEKKLDPLSALRMSAELDFESLEPDDKTGIHFGLLAGEDQTHAEPDDETGIHFGLLPGEDELENAAPEDPTGIHFGLLPGEDDAPASSARLSGAHAQLRRSQALPAAPFQPPSAENRVSASLPAPDLSALADAPAPRQTPQNHDPNQAPLRTSQSFAAPAISAAAARSSEASLELDHTPYQPPVEQPEQQQRPDAAHIPTPPPLSAIGRGTRILRNLTHAQLGQSKQRPLYIALIVLTVLILAGIATIAISSKQEINRVDRLVAQANQAMTSDTYADYLTAHALLEEAVRPPVFLGGAISTTTFLKLTLPGLDPTRAQQPTRARFALVSALLEYRFESAGSRKAITATLNAPGQHPDTIAATIYLALSQQRPRQANEIASSISQNHSGSPLHAAAGHALLRAQPPTPESQLRTYADALTALPAPTLHVRLVLAKIRQQLNEKDAALELLQAIENTHPDHIGARLEIANTHLATDTARARTILTSITEAPALQASPFEKARAHLALAKTYADDPAAAEDHLQKAIAATPTRESIYDPLLDLYIKDARFDDARTLLAQAMAANETSTRLTRKRADLFLKTGMAAQSLQLLDQRLALQQPPVEKPAPLHWLRGLSYLQLDEPTKAMEAFQQAVKDASSRVPSNASIAASAFALYAGALEDDTKIAAAQAAILKLGEDIREENAAAADIHRAAGLIQLLQARNLPARAQSTQHARGARKSFERALQLRPDDSVLLFDLCITDIFLRSAAKKSCVTAQDANTQYLPGMLAVAELYILEKEFSKAQDILLTLRTRNPLHPTLALMLAQTYLELGEIDKASTELNSLLGKPAQKSITWDILEGRIALAKNEHTRALGYFERAYKNATPSTATHAEVASYLSQTLIKLGHTEQAEKILPTPPQPATPRTPKSKRGRRSR